MTSASTIAIAWFWTLAAMWTAYAVLDGYDLGTGALLLALARTPEERRQAIAAIGPVWSGNEVWLIAAGGMLVVSFPRVYAVAFSAFYLALMPVLWLLIARGVSIETRSQIDHPMWRAFWDTSFCCASLLLALLLGVALGNVVRGLPLGSAGFVEGTLASLCNPYALLTGLLSLAVLGWHASNYLRFKTEGDLLRRARATSRALAWVALVLIVLTTIATLHLRTEIAVNFRAHPVALFLPALTLAGWLLSGFTRSDQLAFWGSTAAIAGLLGSAAVTIYPNLIYSTSDPGYSLTVANSASSPHGLRVSLAANLVGLAAVAVYSFYIHRIFRGKVSTQHSH